MNYLVSFALTIACLNLILVTSTVPVLGSFYFSYFTDDTCATEITAGVGTPATISYQATSACWTYTNSVGSMTPTDWAANVLTVNDYTDAACATAATPATQTLKCDTTCNQNALDSTYYTCLYNNVPAAASVTFAGYPGVGCDTPSALYSSVYTSASTSTPCWPLTTTYSIFPNTWTASTSTFTAYGFSASNTCGDFSTGFVTATPTVSIVCDAACHTNEGSQTSYLCVYSSSSKLIISLVLSFAIMLILI